MVINAVIPRGTISTLAAGSLDSFGAEDSGDVAWTATKGTIEAANCGRRGRYLSGWALNDSLQEAQQKYTFLPW